MMHLSELIEDLQVLEETTGGDATVFIRTLDDETEVFEVFSIHLGNGYYEVIIE